ncbi:hypothetical protein WR25_03123 [Diploscapter pachys]|uniref:Uncharacterized protein n=1 Tax=Diploscapter pachys TaxID=2018661 RepID=A0A2A2JIN6_9BILA|nr:hypothetical protein WR25_03123 [Diploscapter pachys]
MPNSYQDPPALGFAGHVPGQKWKVGSDKQEQQTAYQNGYHQASEQLGSRQQVHTNWSSETTGQTQGRVATAFPQYVNQFGQHIDQGFEQIQRALSQISTDDQNPTRTAAGQAQMAAGAPLNMRTPDGSNYSVTYGYNSQGMPVRIIENPNNRGVTSYNDNVYTQNQTRHQERDRQNRPETQATQQPSSKQRSRSMPRKIENNPFAGIEPGWWSKGEVLRNRERRELAEKGYPIGGQGFGAPPNVLNNPNADWYGNSQPKTLDDEIVKEDEDIVPCAGYSGHIQGYRQLSVGKPFHEAAVEAKKEFVEKRIGSRDNLKESTPNYTNTNNPRAQSQAEGSKDKEHSADRRLTNTEAEAEAETATEMSHFYMRTHRRSAGLLNQIPRSD